MSYKQCNDLPRNSQAMQYNKFYISPSYYSQIGKTDQEFKENVNIILTSLII